MDEQTQEAVEVIALVPFIDKAASRREGREVRRTANETWEEPDLGRALDLADGKLVDILHGEHAGRSWGGTEGRLLETAWRPPASDGRRVVACLNVWNDARALEATWGTWLPHVDAVIAVDGAYAGSGVGECASTDGTLDLLRVEPKVRLVEAPADRFWEDQLEKRNAYCRLLGEDDLAFVVDADEFVTGAEVLRTLPDLDVGWVRYEKGIYDRPQSFPRILAGRIRPRYAGRHYWVDGVHGRVTDCQTGGPEYDHAFVPVEVDNTRGRSLRTPDRHRARSRGRAAQYERESRVGDDAPSGRESLRILQVTSLDPGMVAFRLHSAINSTTPHESAYAASSPPRDYAAPRQLDLRQDRREVRRLLRDADVLHCHLSYHQADSLGVDFRGAVVIHHHGTMYRNAHRKRDQQDRRRAHLRLASNPELLTYGGDLKFLPNPVPARRYARMREALYRPDPASFRIGHSPSVRANKGTADFLAAVEELRSRGVPAEPVLIEGRTHAECLRLKAARCDAFFDSFWLGAVQCSGVEAGAMGIPTVGGDQDVAHHYKGPPYTFADDRASLVDALERLYADREWREAEARRFRDYVFRFHDQAAVASRYLDLLDHAVGWRSALALGSGSSALRP